MKLNELTKPQKLAMYLWRAKDDLKKIEDMIDMLIQTDEEIEEFKYEMMRLESLNNK